jgi:ubiquinone biosynthesis protein
MDAGKELLGIGKKATRIPALLADSLSGLSKGKMKINMEITGYDEPLDRIGEYIKYVVLAVIACVLFVGSCLLASVDIQPKTESGMPLIAVAGIVFAIALAIYSVSKLTKKKQ